MACIGTGCWIVGLTALGKVPGTFCEGSDGIQVALCMVVRCGAIG